jgi:hypothetical protein
MSENGALSPGRWHVAQLLKTIGATSSVNVTAFAAADAFAPAPAKTHPIAMAAPIDVVTAILFIVVLSRIASRMPPR